MRQSSTPSTSVIELRNLTKQYGLGDAAQNALDGVSLRVEKGEFIVIMGPSGCGKTTLLNIMGLLDRADTGEYFLDGVSVASLSNRRQARIRSRQIGIVFQSFNLINRLTVLENVALPLSYRGGMRRTKRLEQASAVLKNFHLQEREYYMPWQLSGGQVQRVAIARALVNHPSIILADEPTGNLDSRSSHVIMEELAQLHRRGNTIIMVTHNPNLTSYASRVIKMLDGQIASDMQMRVAPSTSAVTKPVAKKPRARRSSAVATATHTDTTIERPEPVRATVRGRRPKAAETPTSAMKVIEHDVSVPEIAAMPVAPPDNPVVLTPVSEQAVSAEIEKTSTHTTPKAHRAPASTTPSPAAAQSEKITPTTVTSKTVSAVVAPVQAASISSHHHGTTPPQTKPGEAKKAIAAPASSAPSSSVPAQASATSTAVVKHPTPSPAAPPQAAIKALPITQQPTSMTGEGTIVVAHASKTGAHLSTPTSAQSTKEPQA